MADMNSRKESIGVVVIGRNEGERLRQCLTSSVNRNSYVVYVDSGSTDNSLNIARDLNVSIVELDMTTPFTAARARNAGFKHLIENCPHIEYVQFIDGDCELFEGWLDSARDFLSDNKEFAIVCGRLKERHPEASVYNRLCNIEWDGPKGDIDSCGGIFMIRKNVYEENGGMNPLLISGEEPEFCARLRLKSWKIWRMDNDMAWHDAAMTSFFQWWKRSVRTGHGYAQGAAMHGKSSLKHYLRESYSSWFWGCLFPLSVLFSSFFLYKWLLLLFLAYPLMFVKIFLSFIRQGKEKETAALYSVNCILSKFPQVLGQFKFCFRKTLGQKIQIIEYK